MVILSAFGASKGSRTVLDLMEVVVYRQFLLAIILKIEGPEKRSEKKKIRSTRKKLAIERKIRLLTLTLILSTT